jgi:hypothetical protein
MNLHEWIKVFLYLFIWTFTIELLQKLVDKYEITDDNVIKICVGGLITIFIIIQMNSDIKFLT